MGDMARRKEPGALDHKTSCSPSLNDTSQRVVGDLFTVGRLSLFARRWDDGPFGFL